MRQIRPISKIQPVQIDTVELLPHSFIPGSVGAIANLTGSALAAKISTIRNPFSRMSDGTYRVTCTDSATKKFKLTNVDLGTEIQNLDVNVDHNLIGGFSFKIATDITGVSTGDVVEFVVVGDQTYIIPGTILGRIKNGVANAGKWKPILDDSDVSNYDAFRVCQSFQETDKSKTVLAHGFEANVSTNYIVDVIVYGEVYESTCRGINMTDTIKAKLNTIAWV